ncbi:hypothetical protein AC579_10314 [Pseudocercospora musae]|uniref:adenine phosphoribosyltransferase n=1 Tax=Pseudocercospora musae TaxID=113226 RepID=A0A139I2Q2_9PEZI|nr:hypothetical protein AC579_10314 [Pseudocercospora musae]
MSAASQSSPNITAAAQGPTSSLTATDTATGNNAANTASTSAHPPSNAPDPTSSSSSFHNADQRGLTAASAPSPTQLSRLKVKLKAGLRQFPDFPSPGILFEDIMPLFSSHDLHGHLITALEYQLATSFHTTIGEKSEIDVIVGLESRGFLFGPTLALRVGAAFVPVRKAGKLPGETVSESYRKEYGADTFQMQADAITPGQKVVIVDDIIATGGTAAAAGNLVQKLGGQLLGYVFIMELDFLKGREKLNAPVHTLLSGQDEVLKAQ